MTQIVLFTFFFETKHILLFVLFVLGEFEDWRNINNLISFYFMKYIWTRMPPLSRIHQIALSPLIEHINN